MVLTTGISAFQQFDTIYSLTQGSPAPNVQVLAYQVYQYAFIHFDFGRAAVYALVLFVVLVIVAIVQNLYFQKRMTYDFS